MRWYCEVAVIPKPCSRGVLPLGNGIAIHRQIDGRVIRCMIS